MSSPLAQAAANAAVERASGLQDRPNIPTYLNQGWVANQIQRQLGGTEAHAQAFVRSVITATRQAPDLLRCDPDSIVGGMFAAAQLGLAIGGGLKQAYIIPRKDSKSDTGWSASFQIGYPGLIKLATNSGLVVGVDTIKVMDGDQFRKGANSERGKFFDLVDGPNANSTDPTKIKGVIGLVWIRGAAKPQWRYLTREEIEARRPESSKERDGQNGRYTPNTPWKTDWGPMAEKTAVIEALKFAPKSEKLQMAMTVDDMELRSTEQSNGIEIRRPEPGAARDSIDLTVAKPDEPWEASAPEQAPPAPAAPEQPETTRNVTWTSPPDEPTPPDVGNGDYDAPPEDFWSQNQ